MNVDRIGTLCELKSRIKIQESGGWAHSMQSVMVRSVVEAPRLAAGRKVVRDSKRSESSSSSASKKKR